MFVQVLGEICQMFYLSMLWNNILNLFEIFETNMFKKPLLLLFCWTIFLKSCELCLVLAKKILKMSDQGGGILT